MRPDERDEPPMKPIGTCDHCGRRIMAYAVTVNGAEKLYPLDCECWTEEPS